MNEYIQIARDVKNSETAERIATWVSMAIVALAVAWVTYPFIRLLIDLTVMPANLRSDPLELVTARMRSGPLRGYPASLAFQPFAPAEAFGWKLWTLRVWYAPALASPLAFVVGIIVSWRAHSEDDE